MGKKAVIANNKVINIIEYSEYGIGGLQFPLGQTLWDCTDVPVAIGDDFEDGVFSRDGQPVEPMPSADQRISELEATMNALLGVSNNG